MTDRQLHDMQLWFQDHVRTFREPDASHQQNLDLKEEHTRRVCAAMGRITSKLGLPANVGRVALTAALFHDLGRFPQYHRYRTFRDLDSANHAKLSLLELHRYRVLRPLAPMERRLIGSAIILHNRRCLPVHLDRDTLLHCRLIRDADKLDILRVMAEHFHLPKDARDPVVTLGLDQKAEVRQEVYRRFFARQIMSYEDLVSVNEFKLLLLSWIFDLNFLPTFEILKEQGHFAAIAATLPDTPQKDAAIRYFQEYLNLRLSEKAEE